MKTIRKILALALLLALCVPPSVHATVPTFFTAVVTETSSSTTSTFGFAAGLVQIHNDGNVTVYAQFDGTPVAATTPAIAVPAGKSKSFDFRNGPPGSAPLTVGIITASGTASTRIEAYPFSGLIVTDVEGQSANVPLLTANNVFTTDQTLNGSLLGASLTKALTKSVLGTFVKIAVPSGSFVGGVISYDLQATDATDYQDRAGFLPFSAVNKAGTITCAVGTPTSASEIVSLSTGTFTNTFACADATGNVLNLQATAVPSLTPGTLQIKYRVIMGNTTNTVTPQ